MKRVLIVFFLFLAACASPTDTLPQSADVPPLPYPDTPSPAEIAAQLVEEPAIIKLEMLNELDGWAVTEAEIARTNDGGLTWYNITPPDMDETGYGVDIFILDAGHAWALKPDFENFPNGGFLYRTTDGGLTWTELTVPFSRGDLHFLDEENGWVLADLGIGAGSNAVAVYQTTTGGTVWERMYTNDPNDPEAGDSLPLGGLKSDLVPLDMQIAWVTGVVYAPGEIYLHRTNDGGKTWRRLELELPEGAANLELVINEDQMRFVSGSQGFLVLHMSGVSVQTFIYRSEDAGSTWTLTPTAIPGAGPSSLLSEQEMVIYNGEQFFTTRDAANTWTSIAPDVAFGDTFAGMEFVNPLSGWVISLDQATNHRSLYRTHDGGSTWLPVIP